MPSPYTLSSRERAILDTVFHPVSPSQSSFYSEVSSEYRPGDIFSVTGESLGENFDSESAWAHVTRFFCRVLSLDWETAAGQLKKPSSDLIEALKTIWVPNSQTAGAENLKTIEGWLFDRIQDHLRVCVMTRLRADLGSHTGSNPKELIKKTVTRLENAFIFYHYCINVLIDGAADDSGTGILNRFLERIHAVINGHLWPRLKPAIEDLLYTYVHLILQIPLGRKSDVELRPGSQEANFESRRARQELLNMIETFQNVGLWGSDHLALFAQLMEHAMSEYIKLFFQASLPLLQKNNTKREHVISTGSRVTELGKWVENCYARLVVEVLSKINKSKVAWSDVHKWKKMSFGRLASLRTTELYSLTLDWPRHAGALEDIRLTVTTPSRRLQLTDIFSSDLRRRLLHPGTSTLHILRAYIRIIRSFYAFDQSGVLLDRVKYPLEEYLRSREDAIRIMITGLLSDIPDEWEDYRGDQTYENKLVELAKLLNGASHEEQADDDLTWHDLEWEPDPVDAGPGYRKTKSADIIGTLIRALGSQDVFIKEFQNTLADVLLRQDGDFEKEIKLKDLLIAKFGESALQNCEVMIRDVQDSHTLRGRLINDDETLEQALSNIDQVNRNKSEDDDEIEITAHALLQTKILSHFFWPSQAEATYKVPGEVSRGLSLYEAEYRELKSRRTLTWLPLLGQATVTLELADRTLNFEVHTWQATVIYAFGASEDDPDEPATRSVSELLTGLGMEEGLLRSALSFWVGKMVLREIEPDTFSVLEELDDLDEDDTEAQEAAAAAADAAILEDQEAMTTTHEMTAEKMSTYWSFIQGMLKNSAPQMPLAQIAMMLKMLIADGFPYSNEELAEFLGRKVTAGELELTAGKYKLKK